MVKIRWTKEASVSSLHCRCHSFNIWWESSCFRKLAVLKSETNQG